MRQNGVFMTNNPGALKVTIRKFYRASGASTQLKGVVPDMVLPSVNNYIEVGEASLDNPLEWDTIPAASFEKVTQVEPYLAQLRKLSDQRIATDKDFQYTRGEIERFRKAQAEKSVSLNEVVRLKEKKESDERSKARKKELAVRPEPPGKVYDITLKAATEPGLPAPTVKTNNTAAVAGSSDGKLAKADKSKKPDAKKGDKPAASAHGSDDDDDEDSDVTPVDISLDEAKRILMDYARIWNNGKGIAVAKPGAASVR
jgi:carboxyl-terminal processing protease